jgi:hypothetical protein
VTDKKLVDVLLLSLPNIKNRYRKYETGAHNGGSGGCEEILEKLSHFNLER